MDRFKPLPGSAIAYLNRLFSVPDYVLFFAIWVIGSAGIIILKQLGFSQFLVTAFPVTVMLIYAAYVWGSKRYQLRGDRAGDSLYYLGFLFTLVSLAYSLVLYSTHKGTVEDIIGNLGIALATTIVGLTLRVLFTQMREDPVEVEEVARIELAEAAARLKASLLDMVHDVNTYRRATVQSISEATVEIAGTTNTALEQNVAAFNKSARDVLSKIDEAFTTFTENTKRLNTISGRTATAMEKLIQRVEGIDAPTDLITSKVEAAFSTLVDRIEHIEAPPDMISAKLAPVLAEFEAAFAGLIQRIDGIQAPSDLLSSKLEPVIRQIEQLHQTMVSRSESELALIGKLNEVVDQASGSMSALSANADQLKAFTDDFRSLSDSASKLKLELSALAASTQALRSDQVQSAKSAAAAVEEELLRIREYRARIQQEAEAARDMVASIHQSFSSMSKLLIRELGDQNPGRAD